MAGIRKGCPYKIHRDTPATNATPHPYLPPQRGEGSSKALPPQLDDSTELDEV
jgi:hypothetical protein